MKRRRRSWAVIDLSCLATLPTQPGPALGFGVSIGEGGGGGGGGSQQKQNAAIKSSPRIWCQSSNGKRTHHLEGYCFPEPPPPPLPTASFVCLGPSPSWPPVSSPNRNQLWPSPSPQFAGCCRVPKDPRGGGWGGGGHRSPRLDDSISEMPNTNMSLSSAIVVEGTSAEPGVLNTYVDVSFRENNIILWYSIIYYVELTCLTVFFYFLWVVADPMWGQRSGMSMCTDCNALGGKFVIYDIGCIK